MANLPTVADWIILLNQNGSILKARRTLLRSRRMTEAQWYENWQVIGDALEMALRYRERTKVSS